MFRKLFGAKESLPAEDRQVYDDIRRSFPALVIEPSQEQIDSGLEEWAWLKPPRTPPVLVSAFGDLFFHTPEGVMMLDTLDGALVRVAGGAAELRGQLATAEGRDNLLSDVWVQAGRRRGLTLDEGECFDWITPPVLGGAFAEDNVRKTLFVVKLDLAGQIHRQVKLLPPGTPVTGVTVD